MTDWRTLLRDVNARQDEEQLSADEAESIRRAVLAVASAAPEPKVWLWMRPMMVAATVTAVIVAGVVAGHRFDVSTPPASPAGQGGATSVDDQTVPAAVPNRQLQFLTPGGTRIIWVFNSEFDLKATVR